MSHTREIVLGFIETNTRHDLSKRVRLMTDDHVCIDSLGRRICGQETIQEEWQKFIAMFPDYAVSVTDIFCKGDMVAIFGTASGTYTLKGKHVFDGYWEIPAAWKVVVKDGRGEVWHNFSDFEPVRQVKARISGA